MPVTSVTPVPTGNPIPVNVVSPVDRGSAEDVAASVRKIVESHTATFIDPSGKTEKKSPGMVVGVVKGDFSGTFGFGVKSLNVSGVPDGKTFYSIGSVSKVFTGLMLANRVSKKDIDPMESVNISMREPLKSLLPNSLTYHNLVTHTSGLGNMTENITAPRAAGNDGAVWWSPSRNYEREDLANCLKRDKCLPGQSASYAYSNYGIGLLGMSLQDRLGYASFDEMLKKEISEPLNMADTGTNVPDFIGRANGNAALGYAMRDGTLSDAPYSDMGCMAGAGEIITTGDDMLKFLGMLTGLDQT
jgi:CubicO group peptidase (beta-lactamase class C family)